MGTQDVLALTLLNNAPKLRKIKARTLPRLQFQTISMQMRRPNFFETNKYLIIVAGFNATNNYSSTQY